MVLRKHHRILVSGMTGKQGTFWTRAMLDYGAAVVGGVNPKKSGQVHLGLPVFGSACEAAKEQSIDISLLFVPSLGAKDAAIDACEAGAQAVVCLAEHIPSHEVMQMLAVARLNGTLVIGPNTAGLVTPGETFAGIMPAFNADVFHQGNIGVVSRSGSLGTLICLNLTKAGLGQSAFIGVGGDPIVGMNIREALVALDVDERTDGVVLCGEIGGNAEEEAAEFAVEMDKPVVAFIAGRNSPEGRKMGHAGAIVSGGRGTYTAKRRALEASGIAVADLPSQLPSLIREKLPLP